MTIYLSLGLTLLVTLALAVFCIWYNERRGK